MNFAHLFLFFLVFLVPLPWTEAGTLSGTNTPECMDCWSYCCVWADKKDRLAKRADEACADGCSNVCGKKWLCFDGILEP